jgi:hypothetical protein
VGSTTLPFLPLALLLVVPAAPAAQVSTMGPLWTAEVDQVGAGFGSSVDSAGDVNGDGFDDVIVGAYTYDGAFTDEGLAALFLGSPEGPGKVPAWSVTGGQGFANLGNAVASAGDVNGDGFDDVLIGSVQYDNFMGRAYLYLGSSSGLGATPAWVGQPGDRAFAHSLAPAGDVNGDGYDDVIVGAPSYMGDLDYEGRVHVFLGSPAGLEATASWIVEGNRAHSSFGTCVASAGDINADGFDDVLVGAPFWEDGQRDEGRVFLYLGSPTGLETAPAWSADSNQVDALMGFWMAGGEDIDGDGYDDVVISVNGYSHGQTSEGGAFVYRGGPFRLTLGPEWILESDQFGALAGDVDLGDFDGDGYADVLIGYYAYDHGQSNEGRVFVHRGGPWGVLRPIASYESNQGGSSFGEAAAFAGDVNGDGLADVLVGAYQFDHGQNGEGRAFAYPGKRLARK